MVWVMIQRFEDLQADEKNLRRLTGLRKNEFKTLYNPFHEVWQSYFSEYTFDGSPRLRRQISTRKNSLFGDTQDALLFVLIYLRGGVPQEQLAASFGMDQPKVSKYLSLTQRILQKAIEKNPSIISRRKQKKLWEALAARTNGQPVEEAY
jgi:Helix-turn-helix of DDE superfamily endonuclease